MCRKSTYDIIENSFATHRGRKASNLKANCVPLRYSGRKFSEFLRKRYAYKVQWSKIWGFFGKGMPIRYSRYLKNHETERVCL